MTIKLKFMFLLIAVFLLYGAADYGILQCIIYPGFLSLEQMEAQKDMDRCTRTIEREIHHLSALCLDWAAWDETYSFIKDPDSNYPEINLSVTTFEDNNLHVLAICDLNGRVVWHRIHYPKGGASIGLKDFPPSFVPADHPLMLQPDPTGRPFSEIVAQGVLMTEHGPLLIASRPIITTNHEGPARGVFMMGRFLDDGLVEKLTDQTQVVFSVIPLRPGPLISTAKTIMTGFSPENSYVIKNQGDDMLSVYSVYPEVTKKPAFLIKAVIPRKIAATGLKTVRYAMISITLAGATALLVMLILMQRIVLNPLSALTHHVLEVGKSHDLTARIAVSGHDEIGALAREFNSMLRQISEARSKLLEQSYFSGMAEMAEGILHNIRNAVTPISGSIHLLRGRLEKMPDAEMEKAHEELNNNDLVEERRQELIHFVLLVNQALGRLLRETNARLEAMAGHSERIEQILNQHQKWAGGLRLSEPVCVSEAVRDAVSLMTPATREYINIMISPDLDTIGDVLAQRVPFLQTLLILLKNAAESCRRISEKSGTVVVEGGIIMQENSRSCAHIRIQDNGCGIAPWHMKQLFTRGFSTKAKAEQKSGIGLHWCANALSLMGGNIRAESPGTGQGAVFHVVLPIVINQEGSLESITKPSSGEGYDR